MLYRNELYKEREKQSNLVPTSLHLCQLVKAPNYFSKAVVIEIQVSKFNFSPAGIYLATI